MKTLKTVTVVPEFYEYIPNQDVMIQGEIYISREWETASHMAGCTFRRVERGIGGEK